MADISQVRVNNTDYNFADDTKVPYDLLQDTVGFTSKNLIPFPYYESNVTHSGITYTQNSDGSITMNGTQSGATSTCMLIFKVPVSEIFELNTKYKFTSGNNNASHSWGRFGLMLRIDNADETDHLDLNYADGNEFIVPSNWFANGFVKMQLFAVSGTTVTNQTFYPMLRKADIMDSTYEQYRKPVPQYIEDRIKDTVGFTSKNLFIYPYGQSTGSNNGITYTDNGDGTWTLNGTATATSNRLLLGRDNLNEFARKITSFANKDVIISDGLNRNDVWIQFWHNNGGIIGSSKESDAKSQFTIPAIDIANSENWNVSIMVATGTVLNNVKIYPMLRKADDLSPTYEPYNPSVKQILRNNKIIEGKNLLVPIGTKTMNGLTFTLNSDDSVTVNGTATGNTMYEYVQNIADGQYILSGCPSGGSGDATGSYRLDVIVTNASDLNPYKDYGNGVVCKFDSQNGHFQAVRIRIGQRYVANNLTFKPMLRKATETDPTYEPYYIPGVVSQEAQNILGAKNLLPYPYHQSTRTENGITFTDNGDGTITINGTSTANAYFSLAEKLPITAKGYYVISDDYPDTDYMFIYVHGYDSGNVKTDNVARTRPNESHIFDGGKYVFANIGICVEKNHTINNVVFKPMLRPVSVSDDTYTPYAMTNRELTEIQNIDLSNFFTDSDITNATDSFIRKIGRVVIGHLQFKFAKTTINTDYTIATLPVGFRPFINTVFSTSDTGSGSTNERHDCSVNANGGLKIILRNTHSGDRWMMVNFMYFAS